MKRIMCLVVLLSLVFTNCTIGHCEAKRDVPFFARFTNSAQLTAEEWYTHYQTAALLTVFIALDIGTSFEIDAAEINMGLSGDTYVGKAGLDLVVIIPISEYDLMVVYRPSTQEARLSELEKSSDAEIQNILSELCYDGYEKNDWEMVQSTREDVLEAFGF